MKTMKTVTIASLSICLGQIGHTSLAEEANVVVMERVPESTKPAHIYDFGIGENIVSGLISGLEDDAM